MRGKNLRDMQFRMMALEQEAQGLKKILRGKKTSRLCATISPVFPIACLKSKKSQ